LARRSAASSLSLVGDIIMPIIGAITAGWISPTISPGCRRRSPPAIWPTRKSKARYWPGQFPHADAELIIIAFVLFVVIRFMNKLKRRDEAAPAPPKPSRQEELLTEIRICSKSLDVRARGPSVTALRRR